MTVVCSTSVLIWRTSASGHPTFVFDQKRPEHGSKMTHSGFTRFSRTTLHYTHCCKVRPQGCDSTGPHDAQSLTEVEGRASAVWGQHIVMFVQCSRRAAAVLLQPPRRRRRPFHSRRRRRLEKDEERSPTTYRAVSPETLLYVTIETSIFPLEFS